MNEKEAIELLKQINEKLDVDDPFFHNAFVDLSEVIKWLQMRADIIYLAENPSEKWDSKEMIPYVYKLGKEMQNQAHIEMDSFIMWPVDEIVLDRSTLYAKLAKKYLKESTPKITGE